MCLRIAVDDDDPKPLDFENDGNEKKTRKENRRIPDGKRRAIIKRMLQSKLRRCSIHFIVHSDIFK